MYKGPRKPLSVKVYGAPQIKTSRKFTRLILGVSIFSAHKGGSYFPSPLGSLKSFSDSGTIKQ